MVGSEDGQIRMYSDKSLTRANTAIPGLGAPITAVDVTYDGKWVLATTRNYLMVVKTTYKVRSLPGMHSSANFHSTPSVAIITQKLPCLAVSGPHCFCCMTGREGQGDKRVQEQNGRTRGSAATAAPEGRGRGAGGQRTTAEGQVYVDHREWPGGALDRGQLRKLYCPVELQV